MWPENPWKKPNIETRQRLQVRLDKTVLAGLTSTYNLSLPENLKTSLVISSPHSGRNYPPNFLAQTGLSILQLRQSEDCYVDHIVKPLTECGIPLITAEFPRIFLDLNRSPDEWPPETLANRKNGPWPISARARAGLGVIPTRIGLDTDIYPHSLNENLVRGRLDAIYHPYHQALQTLLQRAKHQFDHALLLDCHSMPGHDAAGNTRPDIVLGNCHGDSCHPETIDIIESVFTSLGYTIARNHPYAGGYITSHYGRPDNNIEAVQIEINKNLYLNPNTLEPHSGMVKLTADMRIVILRIKDYLDTPTSMAAE